MFRKDPWRIVLYRTYSDVDHLYIRGRALEDEPLNLKAGQSFWQTLRNTYHIFKTDEIRHQEMSLSLKNGLKYQLTTNAEGYFLLDESVDVDLSEITDEPGYLRVKAQFEEGSDAFAKAKENDQLSNNLFEGDVLVPGLNSEYGVISDIDDTIMHTGVTSFLKLKVAFNTFFKNFDSRLPLKNAPNLYQRLRRGSTGKERNPIFYLSNSPWNLYQYLERFLDHHGFPKGPILLRDFPTPWDRTPKRNKPHKEYELFNLVEHYQHMKFILIGDAGEKDYDYYTHVAREYPDRIMAIYLRSVNHRRKMKVLEDRSGNFDICPVLLARSSKQILDHAKGMGWIATS
jgi:phosphatidate phosphatase APP1